MGNSNLPLMLSNSSKIAIISHVNPDGDSLGSTLALGLALEQRYNQVYIFVNDHIPPKYNYLPGIHLATLFDEKKTHSFDICFVLDCGDIERLGYSKVITKHSKNVINIDHHVSNTYFGDLNIVDHKVSSTSEMIYSVIRELDLVIDPTVATCLYTGIATDTGNFVYDNTTPKTHRIVAELLEVGISLQDVSYHLYQNKPLKSARFLAHVLGNFETYLDGKVALSIISPQLLSNFEIDWSEGEGVVNFIRDIENVEVAIVIKEVENNLLRLSFRSKRDFDVSALAQHFGGGGHKKASGATAKGTVAEIKQQILDNIKQSISW